MARQSIIHYPLIITHAGPKESFERLVEVLNKERSGLKNIYSGVKILDPHENTDAAILINEIKAANLQKQGRDNEAINLLADNEAMKSNFKTTAIIEVFVDNAADFAEIVAGLYARLTETLGEEAMSRVQLLRESAPVERMVYFGENDP